MDFFSKMIGVGYMADRSVLTGTIAPWGVDLHQSALAALVGLGFFGFALYLAFALIPYLNRKWIRKKPKVLMDYIIIMHTMFLSYGASSSAYLYQPSILLFIYIFSLAMLKYLNLLLTRQQKYRRTIRRQRPATAIRSGALTKSPMRGFGR